MVLRPFTELAPEVEAALAAEAAAVLRFLGLEATHGERLPGGHFVEGMVVVGHAIPGIGELCQVVAPPPRAQLQNQSHEGDPDDGIHHDQQGQTFLWFIAMLASCCALLMIVYNVGQVATEKEKTTNAADAVAMSGVAVVGAARRAISGVPSAACHQWAESGAAAPRSRLSASCPKTARNGINHCAMQQIALRSRIISIPS